VIDDTELNRIQSIAAPVKEQLAAGRYDQARIGFKETAGLVWKYSDGIDFYNFLVFHALHSAEKRALLANSKYFALNLLYRISY